jgi:transcriptional regulator of acetoin/glycerol metabolism
MMDSDIVRHILDQVLQMAARGGGSFDEAMALQIERQMRHEYGGDEVYIKRESEREARKKLALQEAMRTGKPVEAASRHGISRSTMYRLLAKK